MSRATGVCTSEQFLDGLARSGLVAPERLEQCLATPPQGAEESPLPWARRLVEQNVITLYQAKHLLRGHVDGLMFGHYEIRDFLGKGGMGRVYLAWDRHHDRPCALKVLLPSKRSHTRSRLRFERERTIMHRLSHPSLATAYESSECQGVPFLALEYIPGENLYHRVRLRGPVPIYWACRWLSRVADALEHAHCEGIIHRDLKASNIMIRPDGEAKLLDLGLARWMEDDHREHEIVGHKRIVGSFDYISPEQCSNSAAADARSDIYSLGCLLYFALAGRVPFAEIESARDKIRAQRTQPPPPIQQFRELPPGLTAVIERMMAKDPDDRYEHASEVAELLGYWERRLRPAGVVPSASA